MFSFLSRFNSRFLKASCREALHTLNALIKVSTKVNNDANVPKFTCIRVKGEKNKLGDTGSKSSSGEN